MSNLFCCSYLLYSSFHFFHFLASSSSSLLSPHSPSLTSLRTPRHISSAYEGILPAKYGPRLSPLLSPTCSFQISSSPVLQLYFIYFIRVLPYHFRFHLTFLPSSILLPFLSPSPTHPSPRALPFFLCPSPFIHPSCLFLRPFLPPHPSPLTLHSQRTLPFSYLIPSSPVPPAFPLDPSLPTHTALPFSYPLFPRASSLRPSSPVCRSFS